MQIFRRIQFRLATFILVNPQISVIMKKVHLLLAASAVATLSTHGTLIVSESFNSGYFTTGGSGVTSASLAGQDSANAPFSGAWTESGTIASPVIRAVNYDAAGRASILDTSNGGSDFFAARAISYGTDAQTTNYLAFQLTTGSTVATGAFAEIRYGDKQYFGAGVDLDGNLALSRNGGEGAWVASSTAASANTTYTLVVKISDSGTSDPFSLFINPTSGVEGDQSVAASSTGNLYVPGNASFRLNSLRIGKDEETDFASGTTYIDNIVAADTFADVVTAVPEPSVFALLGAAAALGLVINRRRRK